MGGITGRSVGRELQKRRIRYIYQNEITQRTPVVQETGNRLGGSGGTSRFIAVVVPVD